MPGKDGTAKGNGSRSRQKANPPRVARVTGAGASYVNGQSLAVDGGFLAAGMLTEA